ncbi:MAG TPA: hypothetical protein PLU17_09670 [Chitinophagaceae bacterium]|nr:hypothetical protein [Chitinophagaceae bacterium]
MSSKIKIALIAISSLIIIGILAWKFVNKPTEDVSGLMPKATYHCQQLIDSMTADTSMARTMIDELVVIEGRVKSINKDSNSTTVELGDTSSMSSIICQIDTRHQDDFKDINQDQTVSIKGKITSCNIDTDLGLGSTIQMNFCSINKHK